MWIGWQSKAGALAVRSLVAEAGRTWNVTFLMVKECELVQEIERYQLEIAGLTSTHSLGSGTSLLERGWT